MTEDEVLGALDELTGLELVRPADTPRRFRFRHPIVRRAIYEASPSGWRIAAHGRAASALAGRGAPATARAHHVERSARQGDLDAVAVLRKAAEESLARAPATAARLFAGALRLLPADAGSDERVELLLPMGQALVATGQFAAGHATLLESLEIAPAGSAEELYLSPKTVETHIRNIFAKLGADSRVEVARLVEQAERIAGSAP